MAYMLYEDSLARMYGAPGSGKSFVAMDIALSLAAGRAWAGRMLEPRKVVYVMAEGQAVNADRVDAWMSKHSVSDDRLEGRFFAIPDAVMLTETAARPFIEWVRENQPKLVVLDTKNAMMVGEENSATDFATMRRTLDLIRKASGCCVLLIDHTGYEGSRARGTSAGTAAMDTEIRVEMDSSDHLTLITAEVTRDKAAEAGYRLAWHLVPEHPAAVLVPAAVPDAPVPTPPWMLDDRVLPEKVTDFNGSGEQVIQELARLMRHDAGPEGDRSGTGVSRAEAAKDLRKWCDAKDGTIRNAWSALKSMGFIEPVEKATETGRHVWNTP